MNKIVLQFGLLVFSLSLIFFSRVGLPIQQVLLRSFIVFVATTLMLGIIVIVFVNAINKASYKKKEIIDNNNRK
jgi:hypothetical protein